MTHAEIVTAMKQYAQEINAMIGSGYSLKQINTWSYERRRDGGNIPYLMVSDTDDNGILLLRASPLKHQTELYAFFDELAPDCKVLKRYTLMVTQIGAEFIERFGPKTVENVK